jgi:YidC/Oxa1 family membrane protein insertase
MHLLAAVSGNGLAQIWGYIEQAFGTILAYINKGIPSYGIAIILLTLITRAIVAPLGVKQIRSMQKMQQIQPELKKIQTKYKGDRQKMNEEMMKLYKEAGVNPLGGCVPMIAQLPVFIALYAVIRANLSFVAVPVPQTTKIAISKSTICRPNVHATINGPAPTAISCTVNGQTTTYQVPPSGWHQVIGRQEATAASTPPSYLTLCQFDATKQQFLCHAQYGVGHLPQNSSLFRAIVRDRATFLGMHLACSPNQASSSTGAQTCTPSGKKAGAGGLVAYYALVVLMAASTYYQQRQMSSRQTGAQAQQMKMMMTVMPVVFGFLSLQFPAALSIYWVAGNLWTIVQQHYIFRNDEPPPKPAPKSKRGKK